MAGEERVAEQDVAPAEAAADTTRGGTNESLVVEGESGHPEAAADTTRGGTNGSASAATPDDASSTATGAATPDTAEPRAAMGAQAPVAAADTPSEDGFARFGLSEAMLRAIDDLGFEEPTPVQRATIRLLLDRRDVIAQAQTGTGKTAAYGIPLLERVDPTVRRPQGLVLAPTRELAVQVAEALHQLGKHRRVLVLPVYGGQPIERQLRGLRDGVHVVVGTPGRLLDHLRRGTLDLSRVDLAILDEADEMLNMGFLEDVEAILAALREARRPPSEARREDAAPPAPGPEDVEERPATSDLGLPAADSLLPVQMGLFSATIPGPIAALARRFLRQPARIAITPEQVTVPQIRQVAYEVGGMDKLDALARVLDVETPGSAIVFCATRRMVDEVADRLAVRGYRAAPLHGEMAQGERERVLRRFRDGQIEVLVATDVAARGLDIEGVTHVVNFDVPWDPEGYVHRIGRTGRAGRAGDAITLVTPRDYRLLRTVEQLLKARIERKRLPTLGDVAARRREATKDALAATIAGGDLDGYLTLAGELGEQFDSLAIAAAALRLWDVARSASAGDETATLAGALKAAEAEAQREAEAAEASRQAAQEFEADGQAPEHGMTRLLVAAGRVDGLRPQDVVGAIANEAGLPGKAVGAIDIYDRFSFVEVPSDHAERVVAALVRTTIRGRRVGARIVHAEQPGLAGAPKRRPARAAGPRPAGGRSGRPDRWGDDRRPPTRSRGGERTVRGRREDSRDGDRTADRTADRSAGQRTAPRRFAVAGPRRGSARPDDAFESNAAGADGREPPPRRSGRRAAPSLGRRLRTSPPKARDAG